MPVSTLARSTRLSSTLQRPGQSCGRSRLQRHRDSAEIDGHLLYVYARDEASAGEIEDDFSLMIADVASRILRREVELVVVLPKVLQ